MLLMFVLITSSVLCTILCVENVYECEKYYSLASYEIVVHFILCNLLMENV